MPETPNHNNHSWLSIFHSENIDKSIFTIVDTRLNIIYYMTAITFIGKTLIVTAILFQAFLLYQDKKEGD